MSWNLPLGPPEPLALAFPSRSLLTPLDMVNFCPRKGDKVVVYKPVMDDVEG